MLAACVTAAVTLATALLVWSDPTPQTVLLLVGAVVVGGVPALSGLGVARHDPGSALSFLLVLPGLQASLVALEWVYTAESRGPVFGSAYLLAASQGAWVLIFVVIAVPLLFFPTGHLSRRSKRVLLGLIVSDAVVFIVVAAAAPGPFLPPNEGAPHVFGTLPDVVAGVLAVGSLVLLPASLIAVAVLLFRRHRAGVGAARRQLRWLSLVAMLLPLSLLAGWVSYLVVGSADAVLLTGLVAAYVALPLLMAAAVVRPELFDPTRLLATATGHMVVTAGLLAVFTGVTAITGLFLAQGAPEIALAATAACATGLSRVRSRVQRSVDRWLYPARQVAFAAIADLQRDIVTGTAEPEDLQTRLRRALRDDTLVVTYRDVADEMRGGGRRVGPNGARPTHIWLGTQAIGTLASQGNLSPELLGDIAEHVASRRPPYRSVFTSRQVTSTRTSKRRRTTSPPKRSPMPSSTPAPTTSPWMSTPARDSCASRSQTTAPEGRSPRPGQDWPGSVTASALTADDCSSTAVSAAEPSSRRCCRAPRDRRGLHPLPGGARELAPGRGPRHRGECQ